MIRKFIKRKMYEGWATWRKAYLRGLTKGMQNGAMVKTGNYLRSIVKRHDSVAAIDVLHWMEFQMEKGHTLQPLSLETVGDLTTIKVAGANTLRVKTTSKSWEITFIDTRGEEAMKFLSISSYRKGKN